MRNLKVTKYAFLLSTILVLVLGCERDLTDDVAPATFPNTPDVFTDNPVGLTDEFFISFDPAVGANTEGFGTDDNVAFEGTTSIRIDVPAPNDPNGNFIGGIFKDRGDGRDLTEYDALTFYARGSITATIGTVGFGTDFEDGKFPASRSNIQLTTNWQKYVIPIPDASKLVQEKGMFLFSAGSYDVLSNDNPFDGSSFDDNIGFTFWLDEIRFESLGTNLTTSAQILGGQDQVVQAFTGSEIEVSNCTQSFNLGTGQNITLNVAPSYFNYSSDTSIANVVDGVVQVGNQGTTLVTATIDNVAAQGSIEVTSNGVFPVPDPTPQPQSEVISIFSDSYTNAVNANFTPGFGGSTTVTTISEIAGNNVLDYINNNFTGIMFDNTPVDASAMNFMNVDVLVPNDATSIEFQIRDVGANQMIETNQFTGLPEGDDVDYRFMATGLAPGQWNRIPIPLAGNLTTQRNNIGAIILVDGPNFILDNIYFYIN